MNTKFMVMTYDLDLPQLALMCYCLSKNWQGPKKIVIVCGKSGMNLPQDHCVNKVKSIVQITMSQDWQVDIVPSVESNLTGVNELQLNKILFSLDVDVTDTIVLDSKDFLLKPCDANDFFIDGYYRVQYFQGNKKFNDIYPDVKSFIEVPDDLPPVLILSPWIWNNSQVRKYWQSIQEKFGHYSNWKQFPFFCEWAGFYAFTGLHDTTMPICSPEQGDWIPSIGIWTHQTYENGLIQQKNFDLWSVHKFWKHSRKVTDSRCIEITREVLTRYSIPEELIDDWQEQNKLLEKYNVTTEN